MTPIPNDCGVYSQDDAETISVVIPKKASAHFYVLEVGGQWLCSSECAFQLGNYHGYGEPLSANRHPFFSRRDALATSIGRALKHFHLGAHDGGAAAEQKRVSAEMHGRLRALLLSLSGDALSIPSGDALAAPAGTQLALF